MHSMTGLLILCYEKPSTFNVGSDRDFQFMENHLMILMAMNSATVEHSITLNNHQATRINTALQWDLTTATTAGTPSISAGSGTSPWTEDNKLL